MDRLERATRLSARVPPPGRDASAAARDAVAGSSTPTSTSRGTYAASRRSRPRRSRRVLDFARKTGMAGLDRDRPLWEYTLHRRARGRPDRARHEAPPRADRRGRRHEARALPLRHRAGPRRSRADARCARRRAPRHRRSRPRRAHLRLVAPLRLRQAPPRLRSERRRPRACATPARTIADAVATGRIDRPHGRARARRRCRRS